MYPPIISIIIVQDLASSLHTIGTPRDRMSSCRAVWF